MLELVRLMCPLQLLVESTLLHIQLVAYVLIQQLLTLLLLLKTTRHLHIHLQVTVKLEQMPLQP